MQAIWSEEALHPSLTKSQKKVLRCKQENRRPLLVKKQDQTRRKENQPGR